MFFRRRCHRYSADAWWKTCIETLIRRLTAGIRYMLLLPFDSFFSATMRWTNEEIISISHLIHYFFCWYCGPKCTGCDRIKCIEHFALRNESGHRAERCKDCQYPTCACGYKYTKERPVPPIAANKGQWVCPECKAKSRAKNNWWWYFPFNTLKGTACEYAFFEFDSRLQRQ